MFRSREITQCVMAGLVPATYVFLCGMQDVGARHKAGHDDREIVPPPGQNQL
jgi:hypothetical protein